MKSIQIDPKALAVPIVAMANADGGVLAIGVSDKTRSLEGEGASALSFRINDFILKIIVPKVVDTSAVQVKS